MIKTLWWNPEVKEAICAKKLAVKAWLANESSLDIRSHYSKARIRQQPQKLNCLRKDPVRNFGERLNDDLKMANKVFWQTIRRLGGKRSQTAFFIEDSNGVFLKDQDAISNVERIL